MRYANIFLLAKVVLFINQDNYLGEGLEKAMNRVLLCQRKVSYALTRHGKKEKYCDMSGIKSGYCNGRYTGGHDAYIFCLKEPISESLLAVSEIDSKTDSLGIENSWIWLFRHLGFKVLNPCNIVKVYHVHCLSLSKNSKNRPRVTNRKKSALQPPSNKLFWLLVKGLFRWGASRNLLRWNLFEKKVNRLWKILLNNSGTKSNRSLYPCNKHITIWEKQNTAGAHFKSIASRF